MNYLIVVTGLPGSGKTTISEYLNTNLNNSTFISVDRLKENIYDLIGFHNRKEKTSIRTLTYNIFPMLLNECMERKDNIIITEYTFDCNWNSIINDISQKNHYQVLTVQVHCNDIALNYSRMVERDRNSDRHVAQCLKEYNPLLKSSYKSVEKWDYNYFEKFHDSFIFFNVGTIISIINDEQPLAKVLDYTLSSVHNIIDTK